MVTVEAIVHGAVSIVSAIATGNGATLGIDTFVKTRLKVKDGRGIHITSDNRTISSRLINKVIENIIPKKQLEKVRLELDFQSNIPTGYGLKSSSAISTAVSLVCSKAFKKKLTDNEILKIGIESSIQTNVSITGAYDDACACYYGGFNVTNNYKRDLVFRNIAPNNLQAIIFLPKSRKRGNVKKLKDFKPAFEKAWELAKNHDYWNASILNGIATSSILNSNPKLLFQLIKKGAVSATISGNGPSIVAITKKGHNSNIKKELSSLEGKVIISNINNKKAECYEV
jgi:shikimate kinase|tara:strand:- start:14715 stop:15569 length:855 start_codon:yes stop_codon:yes gene_type:complete